MYSPLLSFWVCVMAMVFRTVFAVGNVISAIPSNALVSAPLSVEFLGGWMAEAEAVLRGGLELHSMESLHYAAKMMHILMLVDGVHIQHGSYRKSLCHESSNVKVESLEDAYRVASLRHALNCEGKAMKGKNDLVEKLGSNASVKEILHTLVAARVMEDAKVDMNDMCTRVASAVEVGYDDPLNTALFLSNLRFILQLEKENSGEGKVQQFNACEKLLASTLKTLKDNSVADGSNHPFFAPIFLFTMKKEDRPQLSAERANLIVSQLSGAALARGDSMQAVCTLASLHVLMSNEPPPVVVSIRPNAALPSSVKNGKVSVAVTDLRGKSLQGLTEVTVDNKKLKKNPDNTYALSLGENVLLNPGNKAVKFNLKSNSSFGDDRPHAVTQNFKVLAQVSATDLSIEKIVKGTNHPVSGLVASGKNADKLLLSVNIKDHSSKLEDLLCQFQFQHEEFGNHAAFIEKAELSDSNWNCKVKIMLLKEAETFQYRTGKYQLCVKVHNKFLVADDKKSSVCDTIFLDFPNVPSRKPLPLYSRSLLHESDNSLHALPEQHHTPAPPHPGYPVIVTLFFCGLVIAPLLAFAYVALGVGSNLHCRGDFLWAAVHQACIGGALLCISLLWFSVNFPVVRYLVALVSVLLICTNHITNPSTK